MSEIDRKRLFDTIRRVKGKALTQDDVNAVEAVLDNRFEDAPTAVHASKYEELLAHVAGRRIDDTIRDMASALSKHAPAYGQDATPERMAEFVAQIANETGGFKTFSENLRYSAKRLTQVWPSRFPSLAAAAPYANNPEALANKTYGGRMGNTEFGDGWKFRGRGALQLTGRDNYTTYGNALGLDLVGNPDLAADPATSVLIALEFFKRGKVNEAIDAGDFRKARKITNGGYIGLEEVARLRREALEVLR